MTATLPAATVRRRAYRWSVEQYLQLVEAGVLGPDDKVELIDGEVVDKVVVGTGHAAAVKILLRVLSRQVGDDLMLGVQDPVRLSTSVPEPDVALLRYRSDAYGSQHPGVDDVVLLVEVADSSVQHDRRRKVPAYLAEGVGEVWLVDLVAGRVEVHRPGVDVRVVTEGVLSPASRPDVVVEVEAVLSPGRG